jgi:EmrB/QacA subfamily drug resistance transporter
MSRRWWSLVAVSLATFMTYLDNNVTNVAIPTIERSLHLSLAGLEWVVSSYILVFAGLLLAGGRLADLFGRRRLFLIGLTVFTLASLGAGLAGSGSVLIGARLVQGLGAALVVPTTLAIIMATFKDVRERTTAIGVWTAIGAMALAFGPLIGGFISQHLHWGWIFFINVPVGIVACVIALASVGESRDPAVVRHLDVPGLVSSALALFSLTYGLIEGHDKGWTGALILGAFALAAVAATAFVVIESRTAHPMVEMRLFRSRVFAGGTVTMMLWAFGIFGIYFFTSIYLQTILGFSPTKAGLAFVPMALCMALFAGLAGPVSRLLRPGQTVGIGMAVMAAGLYLFSRLGADATFTSLLPGFLVFGAGAGVMNVPLTNAVLHSMPTERSGVASALMNASREVAGLLGITVIGAVLRARQGSALLHGSRPGAAYLDGYHAGLVVTVALIVAGAVVSYISLRQVPRPMAAGAVIPAEAAELSGSAEPDLVASTAAQLSHPAASVIASEPVLR